jgi:glycosyltransferase involved in cell wall biosynthesis
LAQSPRRILMTVPAVGGVWTYALELARALAGCGVSVSMATMGAPLSPEQRAETSRVANLEVFESDYKLEWMEDSWSDVREAGQWLLGLEELIRPDVVHLNGYAHGALEWRAPVLMVGHSCVLSWWRAALGRPAPARWNQYRVEAARGLSAAGVVVAPSRAMLATLERHYGPARDGRVIYHGRDASSFETKGKDEFVMAAGGRWDEAKNLWALGRAAAQIAWPVLVAGETRRAGEDGAAMNNVHRLGFLPRPKLSGWLARAPIYASPARYQPFGLAALEAGLSGCALVLGDIHSLREVWEDAAIFVPPDDAEALRDALEELIENPRLRATYGSRARMRALEFTPHRMAAGYLAAYADLIGGRHARLGDRDSAAGRRDVCAL